MNIASLILGITFTFVELNCENLFDTRKDSVKEDQEYTAESVKRWTRTRYWDKLNNTAREIIACGDGDGAWKLPDMVALCEVENDSVMLDLTRRSLLRQAGYEYLVTDSPDLRGIDVALLYSPYSFRLLNSHSLRVEPLIGMRPTRDILYASGLLINGDTLHVFVVHAPSKFGGNIATRPHRMQVARKLSHAIDSVYQLSPRAAIIVAGDFNDEADSPVLESLANHGMSNISRTATGTHGARGSYKYKGRWESIDHILISEKLYRDFRQCLINDADFLLEEDRRHGGMQPRRNYRGYRYQHGFSDHLPLVARFEWKPKKDAPFCSDRDESPNHSPDE